MGLPFLKLADDRGPVSAKMGGSCPNHAADLYLTFSPDSTRLDCGHRSLSILHISFGEAPNMTMCNKS